VTRSHALTLAIAVGFVLAWYAPGVGAVAALALWWLVGSVYSRKKRQ
jgi:hypothetical protein